MHGAAYALVVNIAVAGLFAISFAIIAFCNPTHRVAYGFSASYVIGMLTPVSEFLLPLSGRPEPFMITSYFSLIGGLLALAAALARFCRQPVPWGAIAAIVLGAVVVRWLIWGGARNTLPYELLFQAPFMAASGLCAWVLLRASHRQPLQIAAGTVFAIVALHFLAKPFLAVVLGSGRTAEDYITSTYALLSQASTGILLTAAGLLLLLLALQSIVRESQRAAETDELSGLANRRGFDLRCGRILAKAGDRAGPMSVVMFDIDHFKRINDTYGHSAGDAVIRGFAELLRREVPQAAVIGRMGGEEFALLFSRTGTDGAWRHAEAVRIAAARYAESNPPVFTVSGGVSALRREKGLSDAMRRADKALYQAKQAGRDCVCIAEVADGDRPVGRAHGAARLVESHPLS